MYVVFFIGPVPSFYYVDIVDSSSSLLCIRQKLADDKYVQLAHEEYFCDGKHWIVIYQ